MSRKGEILTFPGTEVMENINCMEGIHMIHQNIKELLNNFS